MSRWWWIAMVLVGCEAERLTDSPFDADGDFATADVDCDDDNPAVFPGAVERCNGIDDDCDGEIDEPSAEDAGVWWPDADGDGAGRPDQVFTSCEVEPPSAVPAGAPVDCDDDNPLAHPGRDETCSGFDDDCDGQVDEPDAVDVVTWWRDADLDGAGVSSDLLFACTQPFGAVPVGSPEDCDDAEPRRHPLADEVCDGLDNDCDGDTDEPDALDAVFWGLDVDGDGWVPVEGIRSCTAPSPDHRTMVGRRVGDCDDADPLRNDGLAEVPDGIDNNCNDLVDDTTHLYDDDGDGYAEVDGDCRDWDPAVHPGVTEDVANQKDDDCDGLVDELPLPGEPERLFASPWLRTVPPLDRTPVEYVIVPEGFSGARLVYALYDDDRTLVASVDAGTEAVVPASQGYPALDAEAWRAPDGSVEWIIAPETPSPGTVPVGLVRRAVPVSWPTVPQPGQEIDRVLFLADPSGNEQPVVLPRSQVAEGTTASNYAGSPIVEVVGIDDFSLSGNQRETFELPDFQPGRDLLMVTDQVRDGGSNDQWSYTCLPSFGGGTAALDCHSDNSGDGPQALFANLTHLRVHEPAAMRCITIDGTSGSCADHEAIRVMNGQRERFYVDCPLGHRCLTMASVLSEATVGDADFGWNVEVVPANPFDLGVLPEVDAIADRSGIPASYLAGLRGHHVEVRARGGNEWSFVDVLVYQIVVPDNIDITLFSKAHRSLDHDGMDEEQIRCFTDGPPLDPVFIATLSAYDPHYDPDVPSLGSRVIDTVGKAADVGKKAFELKSDFTPSGMVKKLPGLVESVVSFVGSLFGFGSEGPQDDGHITTLDFDYDASGCLTLSTLVPHTGESSPIEHGVTVYMLHSR